MLRTRFCPMTARPIRPISHVASCMVSPNRGGVFEGQIAPDDCSACRAIGFKWISAHYEGRICDLGRERQGWSIFDSGQADSSTMLAYCVESPVRMSPMASGTRSFNCCLLYTSDAADEEDSV